MLKTATRTSKQSSKPAVKMDDMALRVLRIVQILNVTVQELLATCCDLESLGSILRRQPVYKVHGGKIYSSYCRYYNIVSVKRDAFVKCNTLKV